MDSGDGPSHIPTADTWVETSPPNDSNSKRDEPWECRADTRSPHLIFWSVVGLVAVGTNAVAIVLMTGLALLLLPESLKR